MTASVVPIGGVGKRCCLDGLRGWRGPSDQSEPRAVYPAEELPRSTAANYFLARRPGLISKPAGPARTVVKLA